MTLIYATIWGCIALAGICAVAALAWCLRRGQFDDLAAAARTPFDGDEGPEPDDLSAAEPRQAQHVRRAQRAQHALQAQQAQQAQQPQQPPRAGP